MSQCIDFRQSRNGTLQDAQERSFVLGAATSRMGSQLNFVAFDTKGHFDPSFQIFIRFTAPQNTEALDAERMNSPVWWQANVFSKTQDRLPRRSRYQSAKGRVTAFAKLSGKSLPRAARLSDFHALERSWATKRMHMIQLRHLSSSTGYIGFLTVLHQQLG